MKVSLLLLFILCAMVPTAVAAEKRPMTLDDLYKFKRVADPQISPDGKLVVYPVGTITDVSANKSQSNLWLAATDGKSPPRQLTTTDKKTLEYEGTLADKRLTLERTDDQTKDTHRIVLALLHPNRVLYRAEVTPTGDNTVRIWRNR